MYPCEDNEKKYISLKYLINNINMECFDSDLFVLCLAIKENNYYILDF